jgi:hypothetical protein
MIFMVMQLHCLVKSSGIWGASRQVQREAAQAAPCPARTAQARYGREPAAASSYSLGAASFRSMSSSLSNPPDSTIHP